MKSILGFEGPVATRSGYGDHCRGIIKSLVSSGRFDLKIIPTKWGVTPQTALDDGSLLSAEIKKCIVAGALLEKPDIHVQVGLPQDFQPRGNFNIGVTAGIETTLPSPKWIEGLNRMHFNIVPSTFSKAVFEKASFVRGFADGRREPIRVKSPIEVLFEGVDTAVFHKTEEQCGDIDKAMEGIPETFCFLMVGHWLHGDLGADRKDIGMLVKVFCEVFRDRPNAPALILKTSGPAFSKLDKERILRKIQLIRSAIGELGLPNVYLVYGDLTQVGMNRLYNHPKVKAHVSFTHGEGYGRPLLEATMIGKPLLATDWSGHRDFLPADLANLLPGEVRQIPSSAANVWILKESRWFVADYAVAAQKLDDLFVNYTNYLAKAEMLRKQNAERFTSANEAKLFLQLLEKHLTRFNAGN